MSIDSEHASDHVIDEPNITRAIVDFVESHGIKTYAVERSPVAITLSLPNEPEVAIERHLRDIKGQLQQVDVVVRDPRDNHTIIIELKASSDERGMRDQIVQQLQAYEQELRTRGITSLLLFGSFTTDKPHPNDVDLLARFDSVRRLTAFDIAEAQTFLEQILGRRVDLALEHTFPAEWKRSAEQSGIRIFGS